MIEKISMLPKNYGVIPNAEYLLVSFKFVALALLEDNSVIDSPSLEKSKRWLYIFIKYKNILGDRVW